MAFPCKHLWCQICKWATETFGRDVVVDAFFAQAEVGETAMALGVNDNIIWFQVSKYDFAPMQILNSQNYLGDVDSRHRFFQLSGSHQKFA